MFNYDDVSQVVIAVLISFLLPLLNSQFSPYANPSFSPLFHLPPAVEPVCFPFFLCTSLPVSSQRHPLLF